MSQVLLALSVLLLLDRHGQAHPRLTPARRLAMIWLAWSIWRIVARVI